MERFEAEQVRERAGAERESGAGESGVVGRKEPEKVDGRIDS